MNLVESSSTRPYLVRALHEWCTDNGLTPYLAVRVDKTVQVPHEYVKEGEIVLNISFDATSHLQLSNEFVEFKARFAGKVREVSIPMNRVAAIYARESGQGMTFPVSDEARIDSPACKGPVNTHEVETAPPKSKDAKIMQLVSTDGKKSSGDGDAPPPRPPASAPGVRPVLKRVK